MEALEIAFLSLDALAGHLAGGELSPVEVTQISLERTERLEPALNAYITLTADAVLEAARRAEREIAAGAYRGALHGMPLAVKDLFWTRRVRTTAGSKALDSFVPEADAAAVERLRRAGAVVLGKTNTPEFAWGPMNTYAY